MAMKGSSHMKEMVIGANIKPIFTSIHLWKYSDISENSVFYIFNDKLSDIRIYVYKESDEGAAIKEWLSIKENRNDDSVQRKAIELLLPRLSVDDFLEIINKERKSSWDDGYEQAQYDIRKALGL